MDHIRTNEQRSIEDEELAIIKARFMVAEARGTDQVDAMIKDDGIDAAIKLLQHGQRDPRIIGPLK